MIELMNKYDIKGEYESKNNILKPLEGYFQRVDEQIYGLTSENILNKEGKIIRIENHIIIGNMKDGKLNFLRLPKHNSGLYPSMFQYTRKSDTSEYSTRFGLCAGIHVIDLDFSSAYEKILNPILENPIIINEIRSQIDNRLERQINELLKNIDLRESSPQVKKTTLRISHYSQRTISVNE